MDVVLNAVTPWRGWVIADDLTARSLTGGDWWRVSAAEAVELARVIDRLPRPGATLRQSWLPDQANVLRSALIRRV